MKRVLYITNLPAPYKVEFLNGLGEKVDLTVIFERKTANSRNVKWKYSNTKRNFQEIYLHSKKIGEESSISFEILKYIRSSKYDYILMNGYSSMTSIVAILYMKLKKINYGIVCDGLLPGNISKSKMFLKKILIGSASFWMSSGSTTSEILQSYGAKSQKIFEYPFSSIKKSEIVFENYDKKIYKKKIDCHEKRMILYVGQLIYRKGIDVMLEAFKNLDNETRLYIVGGTRSQINILRHQCNRQITYIEFKTKEELVDYYKAADTLILPTREDIWGLVVNEAFSFGIPVITTERCGAGLEMIKEGYNGFIIPINDPDSLYDKTERILCMLKNQEQSRYIRGNCLKTAEKYTIDNMINSFLKAFQL